ncbi:MAG TPA: hemolysin family protein [Vicinamibacteria bacterium]|nr:hemolysin family protein [Vicinamibacteria bacterium]
MIPLQGLLVVLLAALSMFLATVEAAFNLLKRRRLTQVGFHDEERIARALSYLDDPPRLLMPAHFGTYTAHIGMTVIITSMAFRSLQHWALLAAFTVMMAYLLLFRVSVPYILVRRSPETVFLWLLPVFDLWARALHPIVGTLRLRPSAAQEEPEPQEPTVPPTPEVPPPPIQQEDADELVASVDRFARTLVREVMTPRPDIAAITAQSPVSELRRLMAESKYSRIVVFGENLDDVQGVVGVRDVLAADPETPVGRLARPAHLVPETKRIAELLREMQELRVTCCVVIDEYGGTAGLVTVEDIVEELVGEIKDEYDVEGDPLTVEADGSVVADGRLGVERLEQALETELSLDEEIDTVGGLVTFIFGQIPRPGEKKAYRGFEVEVLAAERKRVNRVRFRRLAVPSPA